MVTMDDEERAYCCVCSRRHGDGGCIGATAAARQRAVADRIRALLWERMRVESAIVERDHTIAIHIRVSRLGALGTIVVVGEGECDWQTMTVAEIRRLIEAEVQS